MANKQYNEPELNEPVNLCLPDGTLNKKAIGWSRSPLHNCNLSGSLFRKKRWNYWCVTTDKFLFSLTLSNIDYLGLAFIYFLDFKTKDFHELTVSRLFGKGCDLGDHADDDAIFKDPRLMLSMKSKDSLTYLKVEAPVFGGKPLNAELVANKPGGHETLNVVIPWSNKRFQFTSKQNTLPTSGSVVLGDKIFNAEHGFACLDLGRGKWPFSSFWNWASASGVSNNRTIGLNLGAGWTDRTGMNENGLCIDGRLSKISEDLCFEYDRDDFMKTWHITSTITDSINLSFEPFFERVAKTNVLFLGSEVHQMIGRFSGSVKDEKGEKYPVENLIGWAEDHHARW
jgi:hypothetical protein